MCFLKVLRICEKCGTKEGVLHVYDATNDTFSYLCSDCYLEKYGV
jgi:NMD protein affecting ribosome stability and mRNA decay